MVNQRHPSGMAIFLDRDGTINEDVGDLYSKEKLIFIPNALDALRVLQKEFLLFIITNQSGIGKKNFTDLEFAAFNNYYNKVLKDEGIFIEKVYFCPHTKEQNCICRKPNPYFIKKVEMEYNVDLKTSFVIGDHPSDVEMADMAGSKSIYVLTGHGEKHIQELTIKPDYIAPNLYKAADWIMERAQKEVLKYG